MVAYIVTRTLRVALHVLVGAAPGRFLDDLRLDPRVSPATVEALTREYGLDRPLAVRYGEWLLGAAQGRFGYSLTYRVPVERLILPRIGDTMLLAGTAMIVAWALALTVGLAAAVSARGWWSHAVDVGVATLLALPDLLFVMVVLLVATRAGWTSPDGAARIVLPVVALALSATPVLLHHVRQALADALPRPLDIALDARGVPRVRRVTRHALRLASAPLVALAGVSLGTLLSASLLVEVIVGWPGIGPLMLEAVLARDTDVVVAVAAAVCAMVLVSNAVADIALAFMDPRTSARA